MNVYVDSMNDDNDLKSYMMMLMGCQYLLEVGYFDCGDDDIGDIDVADNDIDAVDNNIDGVDNHVDIVVDTNDYCNVDVDIDVDCDDVGNNYSYPNANHNDSDDYENTSYGFTVSMIWSQIGCCFMW